MAKSRASKRDKRDKRRKTKKGGDAGCSATKFGADAYGTLNEQHRASDNDNVIAVKPILGGGDEIPTNAEVVLNANDNSFPTNSKPVQPDTQQYVGGAPLYALTPLSLNNSSSEPLNAYTGGDGDGESETPKVLPSFIVQQGGGIQAMLVLKPKRGTGKKAKKTKKNKERRSKK